jgi:hypothetical protein
MTKIGYRLVVPFARFHPDYSVTAFLVVFGMSYF